MIRPPSSDVEDFLPVGSPSRRERQRQLPTRATCRRSRPETGARRSQSGQPRPRHRAIQRSSGDSRPSRLAELRLQVRFRLAIRLEDPEILLSRRIELRERDPVRRPVGGVLSRAGLQQQPLLADAVRALAEQIVVAVAVRREGHLLTVRRQHRAPFALGV